MSTLNIDFPPVSASDQIVIRLKHNGNAVKLDSCLTGPYNQSIKMTQIFIKKLDGV